jgi:hypothetical protein
MSQLIALIIAIALGAIVTAIGYVFLGDAFTKNSERGVALQFINQGSQVEMAMTAYRAENARSAAFDGSTALSFALLQTSDGSAGIVGTAAPLTDDGLVEKGYLKSGVVAPQGSWALVNYDTDKFAMVSNSDKISANVCQALNKIQNNVEAIGTAVADSTAAVAALGEAKFRCFEATDTSGYAIVYSVE